MSQSVEVPKVRITRRDRAAVTTKDIVRVARKVEGNPIAEKRVLEAWAKRSATIIPLDTALPAAGERATIAPITTPQLSIRQTESVVQGVVEANAENQTQLGSNPVLDADAVQGRIRTGEPQNLVQGVVSGVRDLFHNPPWSRRQGEAGPGSRSKKRHERLARRQHPTGEQR